MSYVYLLLPSSGKPTPRSHNVLQYKNVQLSYIKYFFQSIERIFAMVSTLITPAKEMLLAFSLFWNGLD